MTDDVKGLEVLAEEENNKAILLAEVAALLHDIGKFCDAHYKVHAKEKQNVTPKPKFAYKVVVDNPGNIFSITGTRQNNDNGIYDELTNLLSISYPKIANFLESEQKQYLLNTKISLHNHREYSLAELILLARPKFARPSILQNYLRKDCWLIASLGACHREAHHDKPDPLGGNQSINDTLASTPFGFEDKIIQISEINRLLKNIPIKNANNINIIIKELKQKFSLGLGDTRRPINEVDLWSWSSSVAALFKSLVSHSSIDKPLQNMQKVKWRILTISFDGLQFLECAPTIGDILGRYDAIQKALNNIQRLLEEKYTLGNEVYRDENGSAFVVPALDDDDNCGSRLRGLIESHILDAWRNSKLDCELKPKIFVSGPNKQAAELHKALQKSLPPMAPFKEGIECWWQGETNDACTTCGVRPQGWGAPSAYYKDKAEKRNVCYVCLERRGQRSKIWAQARYLESQDKKPWQQTIWIDEVADKNGRLALIVGKFDLKEWLNGDMIQTLLVVCDEDNPNKCTPKNPSFARIQRVWRTTQEFWKNVEEKYVKDVIACDHKRVGIKVSFPNGERLKGEFHVYDAEIDGKRISLVWDSDAKTLLTSVNLNTWIDGGAEEFCKFCKKYTEIKLYEPGGYQKKRTEHTTAIVEKAEAVEISYTPIIPLLSQPSSFMILVPASDALNVAQKISQRYELEMSKVRNRLPLQLGAVFFEKRQPLFSALDAARRMLNSKFNPEELEVSCSCACSEEFGDEPSYHLKHNHFKKWHELRLNNSNGNQLQWRASTVMGDGSTDDDWYPYVHVLKDQHNQTPVGRKQFVHQNNPGQHWVHVSEVQVGDTVQYTPSRFTWLHLDTSARRFEALDDNRMYPLEELERITGLWERLETLAKKKRLTQSQLQAVVSLLAAKRKDWKDSPEQFKQLAETTLRTEGLDGISMDDITSGRLENMFELYHHILKKKVNDKNSEGEES